MCTCDNQLQPHDPLPNVCDVDEEWQLILDQAKEDSDG